MAGPGGVASTGGDPGSGSGDELSRLIAGSPFLELLGIRVTSRGPGAASVTLRLDTPHLRTRGIAHGGVIAALLDTALGAAVSTQTPPGTFAVTAQLDVKFIRPAWCGEELRATGEVCHHGSQTAVARGEILTADGVRVAIGTGTFVFVRDSGQTDAPLKRHADSAERHVPPESAQSR